MIAAGVLAAGVTPGLFVYGSERSLDVAVARSVAAALRLPIRVVDKSALDQSLPELDPEALVQSALFFDGLPNDGIVDRGSDRTTRLEQNAGGVIALNGGGGEILRNFFHLPDRSFSAGDLVRTFYRGFDAGAFRRAVDLDRYEERLSASIEAAVGGAGVLSRKQIELAYPLFRCHYWMGTNNSVELRHGYFSTPLVDRTTVRMAAGLPLEWKNAGRLQSALISSLHPHIASQDSAYGFPFSAGPCFRARLSEWLTCARPVSFRPTINATRRRLHRLGADPESARKWRSILPGEWRVDSILELGRLPDDKSFERALSLEIVSRMIAPC
jgi:asparagine synthase (glutamine-hydrolysing)